MRKPLSVLIVCIMLFSFAAVFPAGAANAEPRYEKKQIKTYLFDGAFDNFCFGHIFLLSYSNYSTNMI